MSIPLETIIMIFGSLCFLFFVVIFAFWIWIVKMTWKFIEMEEIE